MFWKSIWARSTNSRTSNRGCYFEAIPLELKPVEDMKLLTVHTQQVDLESVRHNSLEIDGKLKLDSVIWTNCTVLFNSYQHYIISIIHTSIGHCLFLYRARNLEKLCLLCNVGCQRPSHDLWLHWTMLSSSKMRVWESFTLSAIEVLFISIFL